MKKYHITKILLLLFFFCVFSKVSFGQDFSIGGYLGGGAISGFATGVGSYASSLFIEANTGLLEDVATRISFFYAEDFNKLLGQRRNYYPLMKGFSLKGIVVQYPSPKIFFEEGIGLVTINDRTYFNVNEWNFGIDFSILAGIDFRKNLITGLKAGVGIEYGLTFWNTFAKYFSLYLQTQFVF